MCPSFLQETLSYCVLHVCHKIFLTDCFDSILIGREKQILVLGVLRALELSRFRTVARTGHDISKEEYDALNYLECHIVDNYKDYKDKLLVKKCLDSIHGLYMTALGCCRNDDDHFFEDTPPLILVSYLIKDAFSSTNEEIQQLGRSLCLSTLCYSQKPLAHYEALKAGMSA